MAIPKKIRRIPLPVFVAIAVIFAYVYIFGRPTIYVWQVKKETANHPKLALVPTLLPDSSISTIPGTVVNLFDYQFEVPWQGPVGVKTPGDFLAIAYMPPDGDAITFFNPAKNEGLVRTLRENVEKRSKSPEAAYAYLGARSDYELERNIWYSTPARLSLVFPGRQEVFAATWLRIKATSEERARNGVFAFNRGSLRGFQFGDPAHDSSVRIEAFDEQDRKFMFILGSKPGSSPAIDQAQINRFLQTLRPVLSK